jgi:hypothetical protein
MKRFEWQIGLYIDAEDMDASMAILLPLVELANELDVEMEPAIECVGESEV